MILGCKSQDLESMRKRLSGRSQDLTLVNYRFDESSIFHTSLFHPIFDSNSFVRDISLFDKFGTEKVKDRYT